MNMALVEANTHVFVQAGHRILQVHRFAASEDAHVTRLLRWADLPLAARVIDLGCGVGEMARIGQRIRPDCTWFLVNLSLGQLAYCADLPSYCGDFCAIPQPDASYDAALFCFSIGHADRDAAMRSAARLLRSGGILFIYDMVRISGDHRAMALVDYRVEGREAMARAAHAAGFLDDFYLEPFDDGTFGRAMLGDEFSSVFHGTIPAIWRWIKA